MKFPQKWMDNWFLRGFAGAFGFRNPYDMHGDDPFTPYFQYKIGFYQSDHCLYFSQPPKKFGYVHEIFEKMYEYMGYDLIRYIEFHYDAFEDKEDFVRFLRFEAERELRSMRRFRFFPWIWVPLAGMRTRLRMTLTWAQDEEKKLQARALVPLPAAPPTINTEGILDIIDEKITELMRAHAGKIALFNELHMPKLMRLLVLLMRLRTPGKTGVDLFKSFSTTDMAAILRQFEAFGSLKTNTLQLKISDINSELNLKDPAIDKLMAALIEYFFS